MWPTKILRKYFTPVVSCGEPTDGNNSRASYNQVTLGENVTYVCDYGYERYGGNTTRTCGLDRAWSGEPLSCRREYNFM